MFVLVCWYIFGTHSESVMKSTINLSIWPGIIQRAGPVGPVGLVGPVGRELILDRARPSWLVLYLSNLYINSLGHVMTILSSEGLKSAITLNGQCDNDLVITHFTLVLY